MPPTGGPLRNQVMLVEQNTFYSIGKYSLYMQISCTALFSTLHTATIYNQSNSHYCHFDKTINTYFFQRQLATCFDDKQLFYKQVMNSCKFSLHDEHLHGFNFPIVTLLTTINKQIMNLVTLLTANSYFLHIASPLDCFSMHCSGDT